MTVEGTYTQFFELGNRLRILTLLKNLKMRSGEIELNMVLLLVSLLWLVCEICLTFLGRRVATRSIYTPYGRLETIDAAQVFRFSIHIGRRSDDAEIRFSVT